MPYIKQDLKNYYKDLIDLMKLKNISGPGDLNYLITKLALIYIESNGENYQHYNDVVGALEGAKLELYRRKIGPYENKKIEENGEVY